MVLAQHPRHVGEQPRAIERLDLDVHEEEASLIAQRAVDALREPIKVGDVIVEIGASAGIATEVGRSTAAQLLGAADAAMYRAKRAGRGRVSR